MRDFRGAVARDQHLLFPVRLACLDLLSDLAGAAPAAVLHAACGSGSLVASLSRRGYKAWGSEIDPDLYAQGQKQHPEIAAQLIQGELLEVFDLVRGPLNLAFCLQPGLAELADLDQVSEVLAQLLDLAMPGGAVLIEVHNFDHLLSQARRARAMHHGAGQSLPAADAPEYVELLEDEQQSSAPQLASLSSQLLRLYLPSHSAAREDGSMVELEQVIEAAPEDWASADPPLKLTMKQAYRSPEGEYSAEQELLCLTRQRLDTCLQEALARTHRQGAQVDWYGSFDRDDWSPERSSSILLIR